MENFIGQQASIMACLALIGGYDPRPRLGGSLVHLESGCIGVVRKIVASSGKLQLQMVQNGQNTSFLRKTALTSVVPGIQEPPPPHKIMDHIGTECPLSGLKFSSAETGIGVTSRP